ncbi:Flavin reductase family protein [Vibrio nigripulchritudo MADA3029]|uniref:flavin reductase family protein n=1 Tax=Vibrio nigripulchritudo TaxID=28173 RepID=UPI0003B1E1BD|nr:flavin reductase family protein [Vibrio nigripulchritudo]KJY68540.1 flavin reductase [Vibrio nigripulchritudo]CCN48885.1 Flavin reductase family protein [Vibrio nigripulchritudo MADA3020]CCN51477.1 Flavin reductase family protein [Vibrio nigripulchritudo MADA3021]CCN57659.1 Flavin reductase family protein [Vibrio nigripulchritudo MADA3029]
MNNNSVRTQEETTQQESETLLPQVLRNALGKYPTGVAIVATRTAEGAPIGLTINSFASLSLTPPLVLWSLGTQSPNLANFNDCDHFSINVLSGEQEDLAMRFASSKIENKFDGVDYQINSHGVPVIEGAIATLICKNAEQNSAGDHLLLIGNVLSIDSTERPPLVFHQGKFTSLASA